VSITTATYRKAVDKVWERIIISEKEEKKKVAVVEGKSSEELSPSPLLSESEWMTLRQVFQRTRCQQPRIDTWLLAGPSTSESGTRKSAKT
jgi:hypothetical protein